MPKRRKPAQPRQPLNMTDDRTVDQSASILAQALEERQRQIKKWGEQNHPDLYWLGILLEEIGEVSKTLIENRPAPETNTELIQATAVLIAWIECRARREDNKGQTTND